MYQLAKDGRLPQGGACALEGKQAKVEKKQNPATKGGTLAA
jgi:hypothetical protein